MMATQESQHDKRKNNEDDFRHGGINKRLKKDENINNNSVASPPRDENGANVNGTQEYDLEDSDGFDFMEGEEILAENTEDFTHEEESFQVPALTRDNTELNSEEFVPLEKNGLDIDGTNSKETNVPSMARVGSVQNDAQVIQSIIPRFDIDKIYGKVLDKREQKNRVEIVTNELLESAIDTVSAGPIESESTDDVVFKEVAEILVTYPKADPSTVYDLLHKYKNKQDKIQLVLNQLSPVTDSISSSSKNSSTKNSSSSVITSDKSTDLLNDPSFKTNLLYKDLKTLRKVLPEIDPNELYAYLEAHFDRPNRVQIVIDELTKSDSQESLPVAPLESLEDLEKGKDVVTQEDRLQKNLAELREIFPDCDPNYLHERLTEQPDNPDRVGQLAMNMFENKNYPKLKDILQKEQKIDFKEKVTKMKYNQSYFLAKFPDPVTYFNDITRQVNENYKAHVLAYLKNTYPYMKDGYFKKVLQNHKHHLSPAVKEIEKEIHILGNRRSKKKRVTPRIENTDYPDDPEELFFYELLYLNHQVEIIAHLQAKKRMKDLKIETARERGELMECQCCFDDQCLFEDMEGCSDGHLFCKECIHRSCEAAVGDGKTKFMCLSGTCEHQFPLKTLQDILPANLFSLALRKMQEEELRQAGIPDLVSCPFCSFATIMPDSADKIFKCLNPDCLRDSCRLCKEPNHIPLHCDEIEKQGETNMRAFIETKMSEAMLRTCSSCKKRFYKDSGCNKMSCTCGVSMCYVCRESNIDYSHFGPDKCPIDSDIFALHKDEMLEAAETARQEYLKIHPEEDRELKFDPIKLLEKMKKRWDGEDGGDDENDDGYEEDEADYDE